MFTPIHRKSDHLNVHLTTTNADIQALIDQVLNEISSIKKISNRSRAREALKKVILNLLYAEQTKGSIRISRSKNDYGHHRMYGKIWLKYDRLIPIVDGLIELGYVEHLKGYWDKEKKTGRQTKIWASDKLRSRFLMVEAIRNPQSINRAEPEQVIQLKDSSKKLVRYTPSRAIAKTKKRL